MSEKTLTISEEPAPAEAVSEVSETSRTREEALLRVENLKKYFPIQTNIFGKPLRFLRAVDDVSFSVKAGTTIRCSRTECSSKVL